MASDAEYAAFLEKANADPSAGAGVTEAVAPKKNKTKVFKAMDQGAKVPRGLREPTENEEWIYISDADEPFVAVSLALQGGKLPDEVTFAHLIDHDSPSDAAVSIMDVVEWDSRGQYKELVDATRTACKGGDVRVYRVPNGGVRVEYWVVGMQKEEGRLVGVKALAVES